MDQVGEPLLRFTVEVADDPSTNESGTLTTWGIAERFPKIADLVTELDFYSLAYIVGTTRVTVGYIEPDFAQEPEWNAADCPRCGTRFAPCNTITLANTDKRGCPSCKAKLVYVHSNDTGEYIWLAC